jgi:hypothetical protein
MRRLLKPNTTKLLGVLPQSQNVLSRFPLNEKHADTIMKWFNRNDYLYPRFYMEVVGYILDIYWISNKLRFRIAALWMARALHAILMLMAKAKRLSSKRWGKRSGESTKSMKRAKKSVPPWSLRRWMEQQGVGKDRAGWVVSDLDPAFASLKHRRMYAANMGACGLRCIQQFEIVHTPTKGARSL